MAYQVLARKWRPQTFAEVVGQEHISRTLKNAIVQNRIGHAYLFVGSRGIGKTTTARIFAKALNCPNNKDGEPCCKCESCLEVANGSSMDVIEIDGASHNKVEDIRDIRDNVQYAPTRGRYKIYIIDEVHMLTVQAWNALLKTLEEPPPHVKFLFATTEPHKVLPTIVSRCQRFDLKRLSVPLIVSRLRQIATGENINIEDAALAAIARAADGGMRDAQSIFDQIIAFCGTGANDIIREQDVIDVFGLASGLELREIASAIFSNDLNAALKILQRLADCGRDLERLYADLIEYVRNIMVAGLCNNASEILEVSETELADLSNIGHALDPHLVQRALQALVAQEWSFRAALNKRIYFEATLARVMLDTHSVQLDDVFAQLNRISGTLPQTPLPQRPQIIIPPPVINAAPKQENPKSQAPSGLTAPADSIESPKAIDGEKKATSDAKDCKIEDNDSQATAETTQVTAAAEVVGKPQVIAAETLAETTQVTTAVNETTQTTAAEKVDETTQVPAKEAVAETTQVPAKEAVAETTQVPAKEAVVETTQVPAKEAVVETTQVPAKEAVAETTQSTAAETVAKTLQVPAKAEVAETTQSTAATPALVADDGARLETSDKRDTSDTRDGELDGAASQTVTIATTTQVTAAETVIQKTQVTAAETVAETTQSTAATPAVVAAPQVAAPPDAAAVNVASNESQTSESPVSVSQADVESVSEADSSLPDEEAADDEPVSIMDINAQLMQASVTDLDDEADPALADTGESALMASYTPPVVHEKLMEQLSEMGGDYARIGEAIANLLPHALGQYGLTLLCEQNRMSANDLMLLSDDTTLQQLNQAYKALHLSGSVKISYSQDGHGRPHVRYKPASFMDMNRIRANEFVIKANKILGTQVTEGRVPDNRQQEMK